MSKIILSIAAGFGLLFVGAPSTVSACGGFFCGQQPVDQTAETIVFSVGEEGDTTMITQLSFAGRAEDFSWVLPLPEVPDADSLGTFPAMALQALNANTGPIFQPPDECFWGFAESDGAPSAGGAPPPSRGDEVDVHIHQVVGDYEVAVIESESSVALVAWLRGKGFRVTAPMEPYIDLYTRERMKFLALRLVPGSDVSDIVPFRFTLPGTSPSIPLRMTALAAEPEMGILVFVLGSMRYAPANVSALEIPTEDIIWDPAGSFWSGGGTNWTALVARAVDEAGGQGFVTELATPAEPIHERVASSPARTPEMEEARDALASLLDGHAYLTRMYTRLAAEEMTIDPVFRRDAGGDIERVRELPRIVDGVDVCSEEYLMRRWSGGPEADGLGPSVCAFVACGAGGLCREILGADDRLEGACACVPGATARTTFDPNGLPTVSCQDTRMSFLNPGDAEVPGAPPLPDICVGFDCGEHGECLAMNMTPTCRCEEGYVARGWLTEDGDRRTECVTPLTEVPAHFYQNTLPNLPLEMPGGRDVVGARASLGGGGCAVGASGRSPASWVSGIILALFIMRRKRFV